MKSILIAATAALFLCVGCSSKPADTDVAGVLTENIPKAFKAVATVEQTKADITVSGDDAVVKFKSVLKLSQPLFEAVDFDTVAKSTESDVALFRQIEEAAQGLSSAAKDELAGAIKAATAKPVFIAQTAAAGATAEWYGSFKDKKVVDKWVASDFKTEAEPVLKGQPRAAFDATAVETSQAKAWFSALKTQQADVLQKIETAKKLAQKDAQIESATASAQRERDAKEQLLAAREKQLRQLPITTSLRPAAIGNTKTVVMQAARAITIRLEVSRGLQRFEHEYQLAAGKPLSVGHLEGWGFMSGDVVRFSNPSFDPRVLTVP
jgi:hypothetical protein